MVWLKSTWRENWAEIARTVLSPLLLQVRGELTSGEVLLHQLDRKNQALLHIKTSCTEIGPAALQRRIADLAVGGGGREENGEANLAQY